VLRHKQLTASDNKADQIHRGCKLKPEMSLAGLRREDGNHRTGWRRAHDRRKQQIWQIRRLALVVI